MKRLLSAPVVVALSLLATLASAQVSDTPTARPPNKQSAPWPFALGARVAAVQQQVPLQDRVVLVPDEATFIDEVSRWTLKGRWPVLIEDEVFAPMFIRAFAPRQVVRRTERASPLNDDAAVHAAIANAVTRVWGGDPAASAPLQAMQAQGFEPLGIAAYAARDPGRVAAVALAAGRGLLPVPLEGNFGAPNDRLDAAAFAGLQAAVQKAFADTQLAYPALGDVLDALALCRSTAQSATPDLPAAQQPAMPGMPPIKPGEPLSVTDALCRNADGSRFAFCGAVFGPAPRCAYAAMCSLFLHRETLWAIDSYTDAPQLSQYGFTGVGAGLAEAGFKAEVLVGAEARLPAWRERLLAGFNCDVLFLNASGNADFIDLGTPGSTPAASRGGPGDMPVLSRPLALHLIHSFSLQQPDNVETIGGRLLQAGVYAYVGSLHEPYLPAFVPPVQVLDRMVNGVPFTVSARQWDGPFGLPWRVVTLGDPLMLCAAPKGLPAPARVAPTPIVPGQVDVLANCRALLAKAKGDTEGSASAAAMRELVQSGQDRVAAQLWKLCADKTWSARVAMYALEPLYRQRDMDGFVKAYGLTADPSLRNRDMLWQLWGQHLDQVKDPETLLLFERAVRRTWPNMDWQRLAGPLRAATNAGRVQTGVLKAIEATQNPQQKAALQDLLKGM